MKTEKNKGQNYGLIYAAFIEALPVREASGGLGLLAFERRLGGHLIHENSGCDTVVDRFS